MNITYHYPHVIGNAMKPNYDKIEWKNDSDDLQKWKDGQTGYPIVDAGMRHMNQTGWMPNRLRMITSNFLVKVLLVDWRKGEQYFAQKLVDYDVCNNNGGWQWSSGSGADSQPYFRIFNPRLQSAKFDKDCEYIWKWVPEVRTVPKKDVHDWDTKYTQYKKVKDYAPIVQYDTAK